MGDAEQVIESFFLLAKAGPKSGVLFCDAIELIPEPKQILLNAIHADDGIRLTRKNELHGALYFFRCHHVCAPQGTAKGGNSVLDRPSPRSSCTLFHKTKVTFSNASSHGSGRASVPLPSETVICQRLD